MFLFCKYNSLTILTSCFKYRSDLTFIFFNFFLNELDAGWNLKYKYIKVPNVGTTSISITQQIFMFGSESSFTI